jgi:hypothetical protein
LAPAISVAADEEEQRSGLICSLPLRAHCDHVGVVEDVAAVGAQRSRPQL